MKLTPIYPAHIKPVRVGVYKASFTEDDVLACYAYWDGEYWSSQQATIRSAVTYKNRVAWFQNKRWQGLNNMADIHQITDRERELSCVIADLKAENKLLREAARMALDALECVVYAEHDVQPAIVAIRQALTEQCVCGEPNTPGTHRTDGPCLAEQPAQQQEPVAWVDLIKETDKIVRGKVLWKRFIDGTPLANDIAVWMADFAQQHTSTPQRHPWVGLTEEEWRVIDDRNDWTTTQGRIDAAEEIEEKLKEKNT